VAALDSVGGAAWESGKRSRLLLVRFVLCLTAFNAELFFGLFDIGFDFVLVDFELDSLPAGFRIVGYFGAKPTAVEPEANNGSSEQKQ
jgi:hypothetical protein